MHIIPIMQKADEGAKAGASNRIKLEGAPERDPLQVETEAEQLRNLF